MAAVLTGVLAIPFMVRSGVGPRVRCRNASKYGTDTVMKAPRWPLAGAELDVASPRRTQG